ncbi:hypothetical protein [Streptomyces griseoluteus]|uniref:hypothetical protein n=1 Tax=Streptomyces griseoluteus TaxID=29306 RepID=UPI003F4DFDFD
MSGPSVPRPAARPGKGTRRRGRHGTGRLLSLAVAPGVVTPGVLGALTTAPAVAVSPRPSPGPDVAGDRTHIVGHSEVPGNDHTDPGPYGDWSYYMSLVRGPSGGTTTPFPAWGPDVSTRQQTTATRTRVATLPGPATVRVRCQVHGQPVTYDGDGNDAWSYLSDHGGHISNIFIDVPDT